jgi:predicted nucleic acid-binding protein
VGVGNVVLDACVLYPAPLRDLLLHNAFVGLFLPYWSPEIQGEWKRNLLKKRPDIAPANLDKTIQAMNSAFPFSNILVGKPPNEQFTLPDRQDIHVVATALACEAREIITFNLKDFPLVALKPYNLRAVHPDDFMVTLIKKQPEEVVSAFKNQVDSLRNPPRSQFEVLETLKKNNLPKFVSILERILLA